MGENRSLTQMKEHKKVGVYPHKTGVLPKKQRKKEKKIDQKNLCMQKRQKSCLLPFILGRRMHSYYHPFITDSPMTTPTVHAVVTTLEK